jgi:hypothetical protein
MNTDAKTEEKLRQENGGLAHFTVLNLPVFSGSVFICVHLWLILPVEARLPESGRGASGHRGDKCYEDESCEH